ncbi:MAG: lysylphosphatidylglycerol synthase domain-containing protein, partial [Deltaproteobacteria bacterium]|nr:lysylphosphatidylglycerol synthase domain-containing protein [Deltaproteobacteria bacterium]
FVLFVAGNTLIFRTLAIDLAVADVTAIAIGAGMAASLPVSMGGIGVREGVLAVLLGLWGVSPERIPPVLFFEFFINTILPVILYLAWRRVASHTLSAPAP